MTPVEQASFELLRLAAEDVAADVALIELEAQVTDQAWQAARLRTGDVDVAPVPGTLELDAGRLCATFAVPREAVGRELALCGDGLLVRLPAPDGERRDRLAVVAREANELRRRMFSAEQARDDARDAADQAIADRDTLKLKATDLTEERKLLRKQLQRSRADLERLGRELAEARSAACAEPEAPPAAAPAGAPANAPGDDGTTMHDTRPAAETVRVVSGPRSPRRREGDPASVQTQPADAPPTPLYLALAVLGVVGLVLVMTIVL